MQQAFRPHEYRGCEHFTHRNVYIGHTVLKLGLMCGIGQIRQVYSQVCSVLPPASDLYILGRIEDIYDTLLYIAVKHIVQSIDPDRCVKYLFEVRSYGRHGISDDGETPLITGDIFIHYGTGTRGIVRHEFPALFIIIGGFRLGLRCKFGLPEYIHARGTGHDLCGVLQFFKCFSESIQSSGIQFFIQYQA